MPLRLFQKERQKAHHRWIIFLVVIVIAYLFIQRSIELSSRYRPVDGWVARYYYEIDTKSGYNLCESKGVFETKSECMNWAESKHKKEKNDFPDATYVCLTECDYRFYRKGCNFTCAINDDHQKIWGLK